MVDPALQQATLVSFDGQRCETTGCLHGQGRAVFTSGQVYDGAWQQGHMHGEGRLAWPDGISFEGSLAQDTISGAGVYRWGNAAVYEGEVQGGLRHGAGLLRFADSPVVYEGQWQAGKRHGQGMLVYNTEQTAFYEGEWAGDMKHGQGTSQYPSSNIYTGAWAHDKQEGEGSMVWLDRGQRYTGQWARGLPNGLGEHVWQQHQHHQQQHGHAVHVMHNRYVGTFKDGQRHGEGALFYSNGARYEGQWRAGQKHGAGVFVFEDGTVFSGRFVEDRPDVAAGVLLDADATWAAAGSGGGSSSSATASGSSSRQATPTTDTAAAAPGPAPAATGGKGRASTTSKAGGSGKGAAAAALSAAKPRQSGGGQAQSRTSSAAAAAPATPAASPGRAAGADAAAAAGSVGGPLGFGPPAFSLQLYVADVLQEYAGQPAAVYRAVVNLLVMHNTELRTLYDRYSAQPSPFTAPGSSSSWAMTAGQLWELVLDAKLLCRHVQLRAVCDMLQQAVTPPPAVLQRRQQVLATADAAAVLRQPQQPYDADTLLLFRDFCELLVRVSAARYPTLPSLEQQLQRVLGHHIMPLLGSSSRQLAGGARASVLSASAAAAAAAGHGGIGGMAFSLNGPAQGPRCPAVTACLSEHAGLLQQFFAAIAAAGQPQEADSQASPAMPPAAGTPQAARDGDASVWKRASVTVRQVLVHLQAAGVLEQWQLAPDAVAAALLHNTLTASDPAEARAFICEPEDASPATPCVMRHCDSSSSCFDAPGVQQQQQHHQELFFWMDSQLLLPELAWGLVRLAAAQGSSAPLVERVRGLLQAFMPRALAAEQHEQASGLAGEGDAGVASEAGAEEDGEGEADGMLSPVYSDDAEPKEADGSGSCEQGDVKAEASLAGSSSVVDAGSRPATAPQVL